MLAAYPAKGKGLKLPEAWYDVFDKTTKRKSVQVPKAWCNGDQNDSADDDQNATASSDEIVRFLHFILMLPLVLRSSSVMGELIS